MEAKNIYMEIKNSIGNADTKLGIRIAVLGILATIIVSLLMYTNQDVWVYFACLSLIIFEGIIASIGLLNKFGNASKIRPTKKTFENKYYFGFIASFKSSREYIDFCLKSKMFDDDEDLMVQIYINSKILMRKYKYFELSFLILWAIKKMCFKNNS